MMQDGFEDDILQGKDEDGNVLSLRVDRYFFYNGEEFVLLKPVVADQTADQALYVMQVVVSRDADGEEWEEFTPVDAEMVDDLIRVASTNYSEDEELLGIEDEQ